MSKYRGVLPLILWFLSSWNCNLAGQPFFLLTVVSAGYAVKWEHFNFWCHWNIRWTKFCDMFKTFFGGPVTQAKGEYSPFWSGFLCGLSLPLCAFTLNHYTLEKFTLVVVSEGDQSRGLFSKRARCSINFLDPIRELLRSKASGEDAFWYGTQLGRSAINGFAVLFSGRYSSAGFSYGSFERIRTTHVWVWITHCCCDAG